MRDPASAHPLWPRASNPSARNRVAQPETRNSRVSRHGLVISMIGSSASI